MDIIIYAVNGDDAFLDDCRDHAGENYPDARVRVANPRAYRATEHMAADVVYVREHFIIVASAYDTVHTDSVSNPPGEIDFSGALTDAGFSSDVIEVLYSAGINSVDELSICSFQGLVDLPKIGTATARKLLAFAEGD